MKNLEPRVHQLIFLQNSGELTPEASIIFDCSIFVAGQEISVESTTLAVEETAGIVDVSLIRTGDLSQEAEVTCYTVAGMPAFVSLVFICSIL